MKNWLTLEPDKYALVGGHRFTKGRSSAINKIVIHHNAGVNMTTEDCQALWNNEREASAHYQVEADGTIGQIVNDSDTAWHAANARVNAESIGIEHANIGGPPRWQISDKTIEEGAHLVAALCHGYKLGPPRWRVNIFPHSDFASTSCPHQLAPGGEDHDTYMKRAAYWYDHLTDPAPAPAPPPRKEPQVSPDQANRIEGKLDLILDQLLGERTGQARAPWPQSGGRTLHDVVCAIAEIEGVPGTKDVKD